MSAPPEPGPQPWHRRTRRALAHSLRARLVLVFVLLALGMTVIFIGGVRQALSFGWREAARPLLTDYVDRLAADMGSPPDVAKAQALVARLPVTVAISGPQVNWRSHPEARNRTRSSHDDADARWLEPDGRPGAAEWQALLQRQTADGHRLEFGLNLAGWARRPGVVWITLALLLAATAAAYAYVRRLLRPLDAIRAGAERFGSGQFDRPIVVRHAHAPDELGQLAGTINTMGRDIHQMLEAKRALLLAISHELRSPLTRARLHTELLPEDGPVQPQREALLRDLGEMARLITDLLESERLASRHAALQREATNLPALAHTVLHELQARHAAAAAVTVTVAAPGEPADAMGALNLDAARVRLLLRNLLDNALRHSVDAARAPVVELSLPGPGQVAIAVRDFGPGVDAAVLPHLAEPFYRPDAARARASGGVGLGLSLCRLVAQAHGGTLVLHNAAPGLCVTATLQTT